MANKAIANLGNLTVGETELFLSLEVVVLDNNDNFVPVTVDEITSNSFGTQISIQYSDTAQSVQNKATTVIRTIYGQPTLPVVFITDNKGIL